MLFRWKRCVFVLVMVSLLSACGDDGDGGGDSTPTADAGADVDSGGQTDDVGLDGASADAEADADDAAATLQAQLEAACDAVGSFEDPVDVPGAEKREELSEVWAPVEGKEHKYPVRSFISTDDLSSMLVEGWVRLETTPGDQVAFFVAGDLPGSDGQPEPEPHQETIVTVYGAGDAELNVTKLREGMSELEWPETCGRIRAVHTFSADADSVDLGFRVRNFQAGATINGDVRYGYVDVRAQ